MKIVKYLIFITLIVGMGLASYAFHPTSHASPVVTPTSVVASSPDDRDMWIEVNQIRGQAGLAPLNLSPALEASATSKCVDMVKNHYFAHTSPAGVTWNSFIESYIPRSTLKTAGENLADNYNTSDAVVRAWMNSPEHKANLLNPTYTEVGYGICTSTSDIYVVQQFVGIN